VRLDSVVVSRRPNDQDADIQLAMNLLFPMTREQLGYPQIRYEEDSLRKPGGFVVGDSFYWQFMGDGSHKALFENGEFWYYNKEIYGNDGKMRPNEPDYAAKRYDESDLIVILATEPQLSRFGWGIVEDLYQYYFPDRAGAPAPYAPTLQLEIDKALHAMRQDSAWMKQISDKAALKGISLDSMMLLDALYLYEKTIND